jgi:hypothetical protein
MADRRKGEEEGGRRGRVVEWCRFGGVVSIDRKVLCWGGESDTESLLLARYVPNAKVQRVSDVLRFRSRKHQPAAA